MAGLRRGVAYSKEDGEAMVPTVGSPHALTQRVQSSKK